MNIQPNVSQLRKHIPKQVYFQLMEEQRNQSYIGLSLNLTNEDEITQRIKALEKQEATGFVYVGEKNWLLAYLQNKNSHQFHNYNQWVAHNLENYLHLKFEITQEFSHLNYSLWRAELNTQGFLLGFEALKNPAFLAMDELEIFVGGNKQEPHPAYLIKAFEFLHNLEYAISTLAYAPKGNRELSITGIDVSNPIDPCRWELNVMSDYGAEWDFTMVNGMAWRYR